MRRADTNSVNSVNSMNNMYKRRISFLGTLLAMIMALCTSPLAAFVVEAVVSDTPTTYTPPIYVDINEMTFPDANFREFVKQYDTTGATGGGADGALSSDELSIVTSMDCSNKGIADLKGIEYFTSLESLFCYNNSLTTLDVSKNTKLADLVCYNNALTELNVSKNTQLVSLHCENNKLASLNINGCAELGFLRCDKNALTTLNLGTNTNLEYLFCDSNKLTTLDVINNTALTVLRCSNNALTSLNIRNNAALTELDCSSNKLTTLDVINNTALTVIRCSNNALTSLDVSSNTDLIGLRCSNNALTSLDVSSNTDLISLLCSGNSCEISAVNGVFDLKNLPGNFDIDRATNWTFATVKDGKLIIDSKADKITYTYDCGNGKTAEFMLVLTGGDAAGGNKSPNTGDSDQNLILWLALLLVCGTAVGVVSGVAAVRNTRNCNR